MVPHQVAPTRHRRPCQHIRILVVTQDLAHTIVLLPHIVNHLFIPLLRTPVLKKFHLIRVAQIRLLVRHRHTAARNPLQGQHHPMADLNPSQEQLRHMAVLLLNQLLEHPHHMVGFQWNQSLEQPLHMGRASLLTVLVHHLRMGRASPLTVLVHHLQFLPREDPHLSALPRLSLGHPLHMLT